MTPIIHVDALSKEYKINHSRPSSSLRDSLAMLIQKPISSLSSSQQDFMALDQISFQVSEGEILGLIGHNGAGKSTLLKILSRISPPSAGMATLRGRIGSLLEVGTGFHLELTGKENIFLYGAILGMKHKEVKAKFDQIVEFAEIENFLDTPLKHYSSGMYMRLAFAVASHLETEILLVDEVLAVGDVNFQNKSIKKMEEVTHQGRTILLVSHNMGVLSSLAKRSLLLDHGHLIYDGSTSEAIKKYLGLSQTQEAEQHPSLTIQKVLLKDEQNKVKTEFEVKSPLTVEIQYQTHQLIEKPIIWISITNRYGPLFSASTMLDNKSPSHLAKKGAIICHFNELPLLPGIYGIEIGIKDKLGHDFLFHSPNYTSFSIIDHQTLAQIGLNSEQLQMWLSSDHAAPVVVPYNWNLK